MSNNLEKLYFNPDDPKAWFETLITTINISADYLSSRSFTTANENSFLNSKLT